MSGGVGGRLVCIWMGSDQINWLMKLMISEIKGLISGLERQF